MIFLLGKEKEESELKSKQLQKNTEYPIAMETFVKRKTQNSLLNGLFLSI